MTLLTYAGKYVVQSASTVQTTSTTLGDDTQASQTFTLYSTKTVLVIYNANTAHGNTNSVYGIKNAINVDGTDYSLMHQSAYAANHSFKNSCVWVGSLAAGSHTIKGRLACNNASTTCNLTNRTMIIYIFDGDEFTYLENATAVTTVSTTLADDTNSSVTATPSASCKALVFYGTTNTPGTTERYTGKQIQLKIGGTARTTTIQRQSGYATGGTNSDSATTVFALPLTAVSTVFIGQIAGNGVQTTTFSRRFMCVLFLADSTILDTDADTATVSSTSTAFANDTNMTITRTFEGELLVVEAASKKSAVTSAIYGTGYGLMVDTVDVAVSRSSPSSSADPTQALLAYAKTCTAGSHTIQGRLATNTSTTSVSITDRIMVALWFPVKTPLTYKDKYVVKSSTSASTTSSTMGDDTPASQTFSLAATQTVFAFYQANSDYGDTNNVAGFKNAISVDGTDYSIMYQSPYAANYPMRNACVWVGSLASGSHTIKGRFSSNTNSTTTTITNRLLMIYIFDGDAFTYIDSTTTQALAASETFADDTAALISVTPKANSKALALYGVTNAPGTTEHYVGKKVLVAVNGTDYSACEARQSSYATGGTNPCSVATAYALALTANTNYVFKGRAASVYTYATYISRRFFAVLILDDTTLIDIDSSTESQDTDTPNLTDDTTMSISRTTLGELMLFYAATKTSFTTSDIQGNRYGVMVDGIDVADSRTSQAFSASANCCLVGWGQTVFTATHTLKGRFSANESTGTVFITNRCMAAIWLARAVVNKDFSSTHDIAMSKAFSATCDLLLSKTFASENDIIFAQTLIDKYFSATNDIQLSKSFSSTDDLGLSKPFAASNDIRLYKAFSASSDLDISKAFSSLHDVLLYKSFSSTDDIGLSKSFSSTDDVELSKSFGSSNYIDLFKNFVVTHDIDLNKYFSGSADIQLSKAFSSTDDVRLYKGFSATNDVSVSKSWSSFNDELLSRSMSASSDIRIYKNFSSTNDLMALFVVAFASQNDIQLLKYFASASDISVSKAFQASLDVQYSKITTSTNTIDLYKNFISTCDLSVLRTFSSTNFVYLYKTFTSTNEIMGTVWASFASSNNIQLSASMSASNDIALSKLFESQSDVFIPEKTFQATNDITLYRYKLSRNDILYYKIYHNTSDIQVQRTYSSVNTVWLYHTKTSTSDIQVNTGFSATNDIQLYKLLASTHDVFLQKVVTQDSDILVSRFSSSSNNVFITKEFQSINDVFEALVRTFSSYSDVLLVTEYEYVNDIALEKSFVSTHEIFRVIWNLDYPLTVVVSSDERTVVISALSRKVLINTIAPRTVTVGSLKRTATVGQPDRSVDVTKW